MLILDIGKSQCLCNYLAGTDLVRPGSGETGDVWREGGEAEGVEGSEGVVQVGGSKT